MDSHYKRDISSEYFTPFEGFRYDPDIHTNFAKPEQLVLAKKLHQSYEIPERNLLRLIVYTGVAYYRATLSEIEFNLLEANRIAEFERNPGTIKSVTFYTDTKSIDITNPYIVDKLYYYLKGMTDFQFNEQMNQVFGKTQRNKKRISAATIKKIATELFTELTVKEKITGSRPLYIIGYIFSLYGIGLKRGEPILTEKQHRDQNKARKAQGITTESYLQYLGGHIRRYINLKEI